ncbi:MAG: DUF3604 domain-containing protein [Pseudomonadota bacterium]
MAGRTFGQTLWERVTEAADQHNAPSTSTSLFGPYWSSSPEGKKRYRVLISLDGAREANQLAPSSANDSDGPKESWSWMATLEVTTGSQIPAIPHIGNPSNGLTFDDVTLSRGRRTADYAEAQMRWVPLHKATQTKGDGEPHSIPSPDHAFADDDT